MYPQADGIQKKTGDLVDNFKSRRLSQNRMKRTKNDQIAGIDSLHKINYFQFPVFKSLKEEELAIFNQRTVLKRYRKKEFVYLPFEEKQNIYFIKKGNVEIGYLDDDGKELTLDILGEGDIFGQFLGFGFSKGYARALDEAIICYIRKNEFEYFLQKYPRLTYKLLKLLTLKINSIENKLQDLVFKDVKTRICQQLLRLYQKSGNQKNGKIRIPLTHQDVAKLVGSTRETASVCLAELKKDGIISYQRRRIFIHSLNELLKQVD
jgi:CRP/FNR family transcriptional regulator